MRKFAFGKEKGKGKKEKQENKQNWMWLFIISKYHAFILEEQKFDEVIYNFQSIMPLY